MGPNGAGKSTLTRLLLRWGDPESGVVRLDGIDLRDLTVESVRAQVAVVLQETMLFDRTVAENIAYAVPGSRPREVGGAARIAQAHGFVSGLPDGYHTRVGQRGRRLSGGQRQRLAIARALIRPAAVLVLDEPTASLDAAAARGVVEPLRRLMSGRTTLLITHDRALAALADRVVVLDRGRIVAEHRAPGSDAPRTGSPGRTQRKGAPAPADRPVPVR